MRILAEAILFTSGANRGRVQEAARIRSSVLAAHNAVVTWFLDSGRASEPGLVGWIKHWRNPLWCFGLFFLYLITLPYLGSLIGGLAFVFLLMGVLGGWQPKALALHAAVALITVGGMWCIFTFGLGVILPPGEIFSVL